MEKRKSTSTLINELAVTDFITKYVKYADVLEAPAAAHEAVALVLLAAVLNPNVYIQYGALRLSIDLWVALLSPSGFGRNTLIDLSRPVIKAAGLDGVILNNIWGSKQALYQNIAEKPSGLWVWPELSVVFKMLSDGRYGGVNPVLLERHLCPSARADAPGAKRHLTSLTVLQMTT